MNKVLVNINQDNTEEEKATARSNIGAAKLVEVQTPMSTYTGDLSLETTSIGSNRIEVKVDNTTFGVLPPVPTQTDVMLVNDSNNEVKWTPITGGVNSDTWSWSTYSYTSNTHNMGISQGYTHSPNATEVIGVASFYYTSQNSYNYGFSIVPLQSGAGGIEFIPEMASQCSNVPSCGAAQTGVMTIPFHFRTVQAHPSLPDYIGVKGGGSAEDHCSVTCFQMITMSR